MALTYAIPDLHGRLDLLEGALDLITRHSRGQRSKIVTLGDYVDRGPESRQVIERLMGLKSSTLDLLCLKGNHEAMMWTTSRNLAELSWWLENGGDKTLASYGAVDDLKVIPSAHLNWIAELPLIYVDHQRVFVHAAVDSKVPLSKQNEQTLLWKRYPRSYAGGHGRRHVVHGHHADPKAPVVTQGKTNLDGMAWITGRLVIGVFVDDQSGGAVEFLEVFGAPAAVAQSD